MRIYLDIETHTPHATLGDCPEEVATYIKEQSEKYKVSPLEVFNGLPLNAQYGNINTVSLGYENSKGLIKIKTITCIEEKVLLEDILSIIDIPGILLVGHSVKDFDIPFIIRRALANNLKLKYLLPISKKPWENNIEDIKEKWKFGSYNNTASLKDICYCLGIKTPKDDITGKDVSKLYWSGAKGSLERINTYCAKDVWATMQVDYRINQSPLPKEKPEFLQRIFA